MNSKWPKIGLSGVGATCLGFLVTTQAADAASFEFTFLNSDGTPNFSSGVLSFDRSPLKGIGNETTSLSQLEGNVTFGYGVFTNLVPLIPLTGYGGYQGTASSVLFDYKDGELIGMNFLSQESFFAGIIPQTNVSLSGTGFVSVSGSNYTEFVSGESSYYDFTTGEVVTQPFSNSLSGSIEFTTITPVGAVPEPLTMLGAVTAFSFGTLFKKTLSGKSKKLDE